MCLFLRINTDEVILPEHNKPFMLNKRKAVIFFNIVNGNNFVLQ